MSETERFLSEIEHFCRVRGLRETAFGRMAVKDGSFVSRIRAGRSPSLSMVERVREFMARYDRECA